MPLTPEQALEAAKQLYEEQKPVGWRTFSMGGIKVANRVKWYESQICYAYRNRPFHEAEKLFFGDLKTVLNYVNEGQDPNLVGDLRQTFRSLCRNCQFIARRIHNSDPRLQTRLTIFGLK